MATSQRVNNIDMSVHSVYTPSINLGGGLTMLGSIGTKQRCKECKGIFSGDALARQLSSLADRNP